MDLKEVINGERYRVMLTPRAYRDLCGCSIRETQEGCTRDGVIGSTTKVNREGHRKVATLFTRMKKYADSGHLSVPEHLNLESDGFYAFKNGQLRAYWWKEGVFVIVSHFCIKKKKKLARKDFELMSQHRRLYREEGGQDG